VLFACTLSIYSFFLRDLWLASWQPWLLYDLRGKYVIYASEINQSTSNSEGEVTVDFPRQTVRIVLHLVPSICLRVILGYADCLVFRFLFFLWCSKWTNCHELSRYLFSFSMHPSSTLKLRKARSSQKAHMYITGHQNNAVSEVPTNSSNREACSTTSWAIRAAGTRREYTHNIRTKHFPVPFFVKGNFFFTLFI